MEGEVTVRDVMTRDYVGVSESDTVLGAVRLMDQDGVGSVVVLRGSTPVGIMTESDVLSLIADEYDPAETKVSEVMSEPLVSIGAGRSLTDAAATMSREEIRRLIVTNDDELVGVLSERDVISASASLTSLSGIREELPGDVGSEALGSDPFAQETVGNEAVGGVNGEEDRYEYSDRSICEACGSLSRELTNVNGQLICTDCRDV